MKQSLSYLFTRNQLAASLAIVLILFISSCTPSSKNQVSILDNSNCHLPCWNNIISGQTTEQDAIEVISNLSFVKKESIRIANEPWNIFDNQVDFSFGGADDTGDVYLSDGVVKMLYLCGNLNTTIGEITKEIGEPENIISGGSIAGGRDVILINPEMGVSYFYNTREFSEEVEFEIKPEIELECLNLFDPTFFTELMDGGMFSMGHYNAEETLRVMYSWDGYGSLDKKYPPRQP
jgi:hypothetical protein